MEVTGGVVDRPLAKLYRPTFWVAGRFAFIRDEALERGLAVFPGGPSVVSCDARGRVELLALRSARKERAFYVLPLLAHPAAGRDFGVQSLDYALLVTAGGDWYESRLHALSRHIHAPCRWDPGRTRLAALAERVCSTDNEDVEILAVKRPLRGEGFVVRLFSPVPVDGEVAVSLCGIGIKRAVACDARERDMKELEVREGKALVPMRRGIATIRVLP